MAMRRRHVEARQWMEREESVRSRAQILGSAILDRMSCAERRALPEWFRHEFGISITGEVLHGFGCDCEMCNTYERLLRDEMPVSDIPFIGATNG